MKELLSAHLDGNVSLEQVARECGLSRSHLARAFQGTQHRVLSAGIVSRGVAKMLRRRRSTRIG